MRWASPDSVVAVAAAVAVPAGSVGLVGFAGLAGPAVAGLVVAAAVGLGPRSFRKQRRPPRRNRAW